MVLLNTIIMATENEKWKELEEEESQEELTKISQDIVTSVGASVVGTIILGPVAGVVIGVGSLFNAGRKADKRRNERNRN